LCSLWLILWELKQRQAQTLRQPPEVIARRRHKTEGRCRHEV